MQKLRERRDDVANVPTLGCAADRLVGLLLPRCRWILSATADAALDFLLFTFLFPGVLIVADLASVLGANILIAKIVAIVTVLATVTTVLVATTPASLVAHCRRDISTAAAI